VSSQEDRVGVLVVRAFIEEGGSGPILVKLLEVNSPGPDRVIGIVDSSATASRLVADWLDSLTPNRAPTAKSLHQPVEHDL
jgi:hypothetical protein